jgi:uroporphyrinogen decarboxylase
MLRDWQDFVFLFGYVRDMIGVEALSYLQVDDGDLFMEIIDTIANLSCETVKHVLEAGLRVDFLHFWEDICFKNGPLINPATFEKHIAPHYKKITGMAKTHGVRLFSVDSDGLIDRLVPIWLASGVNIMFPIEVGTWNASIAPWRAQYGRELRGCGGVRKSVLGENRAAIDAEIERIKPLVDLGGYIPCPDHRISLEATWDNVRYYADRMRATFCK